ncbi:MAG TPA: carboxypeptidase regulatory-like domain-containing protein [Fibrobacteria bacterium]|nr:carboxypeptidase regulatory-like domain-containing protein [Fibrobacteria bacterium]
MAAAEPMQEETPPWRADVPVRNLDSLVADTLPEKVPTHTDKAAGPSPDSAAEAAAIAVDSTAPGAAAGASAGIAADSARPPKPETRADRAMLHGVILSAEDGKPVAKVTVILQRDSLRLSAPSDEAGLFRITEIAPGTWRISAYRKGYESKALDPETFAAGEDRVLEIRLERRVLKGQVVQAKTERKAGSAQDLLAKRQKAAGVMEGVSAEQIAKTTDSDAGAIARRITGTSLVGGKYVYVRGLGERYTNMTLNGLPVPSPEKDKRVVPQDLFPAGTLESFSIYKTFVPDLYSDFAGGSVALVTKGIPEKAFFKVSLSTGNHYYGRMDSADYLQAYMAESPKNGRAPKALPAGWQVGNRRMAYDGGNTFWGFDDGTRSLPDGFPLLIPKGYTEAQAQDARSRGLPGYTPEERIQLANALSNTYAIDTTRVRNPTNFSISGGNVYPAGGGGKFGYLATAGFKNKYDQDLIEKQDVVAAYSFVKDTVFHPLFQREVVIRTQLFDTVQTDSGPVTTPVRSLQPNIAAQINRGSYEAQLSGMLNMRYENPDWSVWWKNFAINIGTDYTLMSRSYQSDRGGGLIPQDRPYEERYLLEFSRRSLISSQVGGEAYVGVGLLDSVSWAAGLSAVTGETPDSRRYLYSQTAVNTTQPLTFANNDVWGTRIFETLDEKAAAARLDGVLVIPPEYSARDTFLTESQLFSHLALPNFNAGLAWNGRKRSFNATRYSYDADRRTLTGKTLEEIRAPEALTLDMQERVSDFATSPKDRDTYDASEIKAAAYLAGAVSARLWSMPIGIDGGVRGEWFDFNLVAPYTGGGEGYGDIHSKTREWSAYPTAGLWVKPIQALKLRWQYAQTAVHPEIREVAPYTFADYVSGRTITGNPDLKKTQIAHFDARADLYLPFQQSLSASLFYKDFTRPVETTIDNNKVESYQNANGAYVKGVEFEAVLNPGGLLEGLGASVPWLKGLMLSGNFALMESEVRIREDTTQNLQNTNYRRPMVGQAPYLINGSVTHEAEAGPFAFLNAVLFNKAGERIRYAGTMGLPDITEKPFASLESLHRLTWWKRNELGVRVKNWLMQSKELRVKENNDQIPYHSVTPGQYQEVFGNVSRYQTVERIQDGIWIEVNYARLF